MTRVRLEERKKEALADDLLWGAKAIADYLGLRVGQVYHLIRTKRLPVRKLSGAILVARKSELQALLSAKEE